MKKMVGFLSIIALASFIPQWSDSLMEGTKLIEINPYFEKIAKERGFWSRDLMERIADKGSEQDFEEIPADVKAVFDKVSEEWVDKSALMSNNTDVVGAQFSKEKGMTFIDLSPEEAKRWRDLVAPAADAYVQTMVGKGFSKQEVQGWLDYIKSRIDFWLKEQIKRGIKSPIGPPEIRG